MTCFCNQEGVCLLCGTNWVFKYSKCNEFFSVSLEIRYNWTAEGVGSYSRVQFNVRMLNLQGKKGLSITCLVLPLSNEWANTWTIMNTLRHVTSLLYFDFYIGTSEWRPFKHPSWERQVKVNWYTSILSRCGNRFENCTFAWGYSFYNVRKYGLTPSYFQYVKT